MKNNVVRYTVISLVVVAALAAVMSSFLIWHQPKTPECVA